MAEIKTVSPNPPDHPGMDFARLRQEGLELIQKLAGHNWTDHNTHDPGITILEHLCYAITDLSYRLSFPMEDLLALPDTMNPGSRKQFFPAAEILPISPVTITDYRKLLIDIPGVKNAWLTTESLNNPEFYVRPADASIAFGIMEAGERQPLKGCYQVQIEKDEGAGLSDGELAARVNSVLQQNRNLCEDFRPIEIVPVETVTLKAEIQLHDAADANQIVAELYPLLAELVSPTVKFLSLEEMLDRGNPVEEIFNGPLLHHGFIDDADLESISRKKELYVSDFIQIMLDHPGVKAVETISLFSAVSSVEADWALNLSPFCTPKLKDLDSLVNSGDIRIHKGRISCALNNLSNSHVSQEIGLKPAKGKPERTSKGPQPPQGRYRELFDYLPLETDFPANYGIGETGLPESVSDQRKAQARQLRGYLLLFDQILANYFIQLEHAKDLLSVDNDTNQTLFCQVPKGADDLLAIQSEQDLEALFYDANGSDRFDQESAHRNNLLDHLLARFGTTFPDYSLNSPEKHLSDKQRLLTSIAWLGTNRNKARNYLADGDFSGLKQIIRTKLGLTAEEAEFIVVEHLLLCPVAITNKAAAAEPDSIRIKQELFPDPFSFRLTIAFPQNQGRYAADNFRILVEETLRAEIPAHISYRELWLEHTALVLLNETYEKLLQAKINDPFQVSQLAFKLIELLHLKETEPEKQGVP